MSWINWKKNEKKDEFLTFDKVLDLFKIVSAKLSALEKDMDMVKIRLKSRAFKKSAPDDEEIEAKNTKTTDAFDEIRNIKKNIYDERIGI